MIKNIKKGFLALSAIGVISPILTINLGSVKLYLTLLNFGLKGSIPVILIILFSLYPFYLNEKMQDKFSIVFNLINLLLVIITIFTIKTKVSNSINSLGFFSNLVANNMNYSWGILFMIIGVVGIMFINIYEIYTIRKNDNYIK